MELALKSIRLHVSSFAVFGATVLYYELYFRLYFFGKQDNQRFLTE
jgi:hypothetical protein